MEYLHVDKKVIHRDLKPANIFIDRIAPAGTLSLVVGDVGSSKELQNTMAHASVAGTPAYIAPEAGRTQRCTFASDVYSASVVVVELLVGGGGLFEKETEEERNAMIDQAMERASSGLPFEEGSGVCMYLRFVCVDGWID